MSQHTWSLLSIDCESQNRGYLIKQAAHNIGTCYPHLFPTPFFEPKVDFENKIAEVWICGFMCSKQNSIVASNIHSHLRSAYIAIDPYGKCSCHGPDPSAAAEIRQRTVECRSNLQSLRKRYMNFLEWSVRVKDVVPMWNWKQTQLLHKYDP